MGHNSCNISPSNSPTDAKIYFNMLWYNSMPLQGGGQGGGGGPLLCLFQDVLDCSFTPMCRVESSVVITYIYLSSALQYQYHSYSVGSILWHSYLGWATQVSVYGPDLISCNFFLYQTILEQQANLNNVLDHV